MEYAPQPSPSKNLSVAGLPALSNAQLKAIFSAYGTVEDCQMLPDNLGGAGVIGQGALIVMETVQQATWLVENLSGTPPLGLTSPVVVSFLAAPGEAATAVLDDQLSSGMSMYGIMAAAMQNAMPDPAASETLQCGVQLKGVIKRWEDAKGFGFINPNGGGPEVKVYMSEVRGAQSVCGLHVGTEVIFKAGEDPPGRYHATYCKPWTCSAPGNLGKKSKDPDSMRTNNLFITGLPRDMTEDTAWVVFSQYGNVLSVKKLPANRKPDSAMIVCMGTVEEADYMVKNVVTPPGLTRPIQIRFSENKGYNPYPPGCGPKKLPAAGWFRAAGAPAPY